jgi:hypothetical protein
MSIRIGIIGGSGLYDMAALTDRHDVRVTTPFGDPSGLYVTGTLAGRRVAFLARHGPGHRLMPSELNYRANIYGFKTLGVEFQLRARNNDRERPVQFVVTGPLPCEVNIRADFEAATATVELINVRRFGRFTVRLATETFRDAVDDLARYVLGVDEDFKKLIAKA